jgi:hypothetical protein
MVDRSKRASGAIGRVGRSPAEKSFYGDSCAQIARQAQSIRAPGDWSRFLDPDSPENPLNHVAGYICEGSVLAVGSVPRSGAAAPSVPVTQPEREERHT